MDISEEVLMFPCLTENSHPETQTPSLPALQISVDMTRDDHMEEDSGAFESCRSFRNSY
jgi:hypothetical protein